MYNFFSFLKKTFLNLFIYLAALGRSVGTWNLRLGARAALSLWHADLVAPRHVGS